jgi:hypothetical protein
MQRNVDMPNTPWAGVGGMAVTAVPCGRHGMNKTSATETLFFGFFFSRYASSLPTSCCFPSGLSHGLVQRQM